MSKKDRGRRKAAAGESMRAKYDAWHDFWWSPAGAFGGYVSAETALKVPAVVDALSAITQPIAHLPLKVFEDLGDGNKAPAKDHPAAALLANPWDEATPYEWRGQMQWNLALHSNAYARILPRDGSYIGALRPIHPSLVTPRRLPDGSVRFRVHDGGAILDLDAGEIWHLKALPFDSDGLRGVSRVETNAETIAHALAVQDYGRRFFANDGQAGAVLEHPGTFRDDEQRQKFLKAWQAASTGENQHRTRVLEGGAKLQRHQINNEHAQFLETRKEMAVEIARIWNVPPHKIRSLERATFSNIEHQGLEFVTDTLAPWVSLWEQRITRDLVEPLSQRFRGRRFFAEFNLAGLLRGDIRSRYQAYAIGRQWGWLSVNDIRRIETMNPVEGGDEYLQPLNMVPAGNTADARDQNAEDGAEPRRLTVVNGGA